MRGRVYIRETIMKIKHIASLISLGLALPAFAAENINLDDVVVTASRTPQTRESVIADVNVIGQAQIERTGQTTLVELLAQQPGIEITSSGGAGSTSGIFMRGTNSGNVVVLIDGLRIDSATLGATAFENIPLGQIEKIEILRGPASSLYGQDAIGGVIQIFTKKGIDGAIKLNANLGYGTYDTIRADAGVSGKLSNTSFSFNASSLKTNSFSAIKTKNNDYIDNDANRNLAFSGNVTHEIESGHEIGLQFLHSDGRVHFDNSCPLDASFNCILGRFDSLSDAKQYSYAVFSNNQFTEFWLSKVRIGQGVDESRTFDVTSVKGGDFFQTKQLQINWQNDFKLPLGTLTLMYDGLEQKVNSTIKYDLKERENDGFVASYLLNANAQSFQASLRRDSNSQFGGKTTGNIGYGLNFSPRWRATTSFGTAYKAPNFNDLYYPFFGNPNLKPEESRNIEASLRYQANSTSASATIYHNKVNNLIGYDNATNSVLNIKKATLNGLSLNANQHWDNLSVAGNIDIQSPIDDDTKKLLVRRANRHASANVSYTMGDWRFGAETIASSVRYNDGANTVKLGGYTLLNATVNYQFNKDWSAQARANNLLDKEYALGADFGGEFYNTPGANLFVNVRYEPQ
jgi:vitamin B12 transporter